jgi:hypothetical protein
MCRAPTAPRAAPLRATCYSSTPPADHPTALASPRLATPYAPARAALRHRSQSLQPDRRHLLLLAAPRVAPRPTAALVLPAVYSRMRHAAPPLPELHPRPPRTPSAASTYSRSPCLLLDLKHVPELPVHSLLPSRTHICTAFFLPKLHALPEPRRCLDSPSTAAAAASHPRSVLQQHRRDPLKLTSPPNFVLRPTEHRRCPSELRCPSLFAVDPPPQPFSSPTLATPMTAVSS